MGSESDVNPFSVSKYEKCGFDRKIGKSSQEEVADRAGIPENLLRFVDLIT